MAVKILTTTEGKAVMYCSIEQWTFGPVFDSPAQASEFLHCFFAYGLENGTDPRTLTKIQLQNCFNEYMTCCEYDFAKPREAHGGTDTE